MYQVIDIQTKTIVGIYDTAKKARAVRDRKDAAYGSVRYVLRKVSA